MIHVDALSVRYGDDLALQDVTLQVQQGETVLVTGPSGCGKSTLAHAICGLIPHAVPADIQGSVTVSGMDTLAHDIPTLAQHVGIVFQKPSAQLFHLRVDEEVAFGLRNLGFDETTVRERVRWALEAVGLAGMEGCRPVELSGGQKQRLAIASVLAMRPRVLVLDEPLASLDIEGSNQVIETLKFLQTNYGITLFLIEHRLGDVIHFVGRLLLMDGGCIVADGQPERVLSDQALLDRLGLRRLTEEPKSAWKSLIEPHNNGHRPDETPLLTLSGVSAGYGRRMVLEDVNLSLYPGDFAALVGRNGVGKSTLAMVAAGLIKPQRGRVQFCDGKRPRPGRDVTLLFQNPTDQLFTMSVDEEVAFGPRNFDCFDPQAHLDLLEQMGLADLRQRSPLMLSVGQQQRTAMAACLAMKPRLIILDEPTLGQDWGHLQRIMALLTTLNQNGTAVLLVTHDYKLVHRYVKRVFLLEDGHVSVRGFVKKSTDSTISAQQRK